MLKHPLRWLTGLGAAGALVAASATPAVAAATIEPYFQDSTLAVGSTPTTRALFLYADEPTILTDVSVRYDYRSLANKITVVPADGQKCTAPETGVLVCEEPYDVVLHEVPPLGSGTYRNVTKRVRLGLTEDAQLGDSGDVAVSFQAAGGRSGSYTSQVRVGEGVDLAGGPYTTLSAKPGGKFTVPLAVANAGDTDVNGFVAVFDLSYSIRTRDRFSNCRYSDDHLVSCQFDEEIPVGTGLVATLNLELAKDTYAPTNQSGYAQFMTTADFEDLTRVRAAVGARAATPGSGPKLTLTEGTRQDAEGRPDRRRPRQRLHRVDHQGHRHERHRPRGDRRHAQGHGRRRRHGDRRLPEQRPRDARQDERRLRGRHPHRRRTAAGHHRRRGPRQLPVAAGHPHVPVRLGDAAGGRAELHHEVPATHRQGHPQRREARCGSTRLCECPAGGSFQDDIKPANDKATIVVNAAQSGGGQGDGDGGGGGGGVRCPSPAPPPP